MDFRNSYPEWCGSCTALLHGEVPDTDPSIPVSDTLPLMGLRSLRISAGVTMPHRAPHLSCDSLSSAANSSTDSSDTDDRCDSSLGKPKHQNLTVTTLKTRLNPTATRKNAKKSFQWITQSY